jgi:stage II sporulation protein AA (anti-sigma F factor antagonist)
MNDQSNAQAPVAEMKILPSIKEVSCVALKGRLDASGLSAVEAQFTTYIGSQKKPTIIDLSGVTHLPSGGMRMLVNVAKTLRAAGAKTVLLNPEPLIERSLKAACLDQVFPILHDDLEAIKLCLGR